MSKVVRPATVADVPHVLPMVRAICDLHHGWDPDRYDFRDDIVDLYASWLPKRATDPRGVFLVGETRTDGAAVLVGFVIATIEREIPIFKFESIGFIHDLWVEPGYRRGGFGAALAREAAARLRALGVTQIRLDTAAANEPARRLFASVGFRPSTVQMVLAIGEPGRDSGGRPV